MTVSFISAVATLPLALFVPAPSRLRRAPKLGLGLLFGALTLLVLSVALPATGHLSAGMVTCGSSLTAFHLLFWCAGIHRPPDDDESGGGGGNTPDEPPPPNWDDFDALRSGWERDRDLLPA